MPGQSSRPPSYRSQPTRSTARCGSILSDGTSEEIPCGFDPPVRCCVCAAKRNLRFQIVCGLIEKELKSLRATGETKGCLLLVMPYQEEISFRHQLTHIPREFKWPRIKTLPPKAGGKDYWKSRHARNEIESRLLKLEPACVVRAYFVEVTFQKKVLFGPKVSGTREGLMVEIELP